MKLSSKPATRPRHVPKAIDLFAGAGGLTLGLKKAGFKVLGAVEINELAVEAYRANHPDVVVYRKDISLLTAKTVLQRFKLQPGELDLVAGCPPCQGFSSMRTLNGSRWTRDSRNNLVSHFIRFVRVLSPKAVMLENVPGLARNRRFAELVKALKALGYTVDHKILNAADFAVPQRRKRLILIAIRGKSVEFAAPAQVKRTVRDAICDLDRRKKRDSLHDVSQERSERIMRLIRSIPKDGGSRSHLSVRKQLACHRRCNGFKDVYGRMAWDDVAPTITSGCLNPSKGRFLHPSRNRPITLREAAVLQGFPRRYKFPLTRGRYAAALLVGNALPPEFIRRHAKKLLFQLTNRS
jgi:DNA (cytosine-5)-methyltransferase 1